MLSPRIRSGPGAVVGMPRLLEAMQASQATVISLLEEQTQERVPSVTGATGTANTALAEDDRKGPSYDARANI